MARSRRTTRQPETRPVVYDGYYGGFVPVENASSDVSTTPDAIVELPWPDEQATAPRPPQQQVLRCDACRQRKRDAQHCRDGLLVLCRACAGQDVPARDADQVMERLLAAAPSAERPALRRQLETRLALRLKRRDRKTGAA